MKTPAFAKLVLFINSAVPLAMLGWDWYRDQLGTNPINFALRTAGMCAGVSDPHADGHTGAIDHRE